MKIDVMQALKLQGERFAYRFEEAILPLPVTEKAICFLTEGSYVYESGFVLIQGELSVRISTNCDRCLKEIDFPLQLTYMAICKKAPDEENGEYAIVEEAIDLLKIVQDEILLHMPLQMLCNADCKGFCAKCGVNLNEKECSCEAVGKNKTNPFTKLKGLFE